MDRYLGGEEVDVDTLIADLRDGGRPRHLLPRRCRSPPSPAWALGELLELFAAASPPPTGAPAAGRDHARRRARGRRCSATRTGRWSPRWCKTTTDPYVGRVSLVRVFSGTLRPDATVHVSGHLAGFAGHDVEGHEDHDEDERIGPLSSPAGRDAAARAGGASPATSARSPS